MVHVIEHISRFTERKSRTPDAGSHKRGEIPISSVWLTVAIFKGFKQDISFVIKGESCYSRTLDGIIELAKVEHFSITQSVFFRLCTALALKLSTRT